MIKTLLMALTCLTSTIISAQEGEQLRFQKGSFTISGAFSVNSTSSERQSEVSGFEEEGTGFGYSFGPAISYFLSDHFAIGSRLVVGTNKRERKGRSKNTSDLLRYGFFGSYYFTPEKKFSLLTTLGADFMEDKRVQERINTDDFNVITGDKDTGVDIGLSAGINYFVTSHFALNARLGVLSYSVVKNTANDGGNSSSNKVFRLNTELRNISFGLLYRI